MNNDIILRLLLGILTISGERSMLETNMIVSPCIKPNAATVLQI